ncbi:transcription elongation factor GreB [Betaproteobacteria bacterium SCN1]|jgi:transcription elongation factor GreB|nr:transcription elongation factor GreB [Betaproteobacteria bacterium SCN1]MBN8761566.1 transcription elongation factor GreB [Thiobacillus sp.]ODU88748.1 MAG: transcription elongation factor GreB [Thiobacillus sp. SCN 65-179]OJW39074.1 MAG: transcription elongation factor GreB [Thiobacillus sp. 65-69]
MNKAFVKESDAPDDDENDVGPPALPAGSKNYMTPAGYARLDAEFNQLWKTERPKLVETIAWAASNGDRSENGDYLYGKKRLREVDRRIRFLSKRLEHAEVVDPATREDTDQVFFGATVTIADASGDESTYAIVGIDEADAARGRIAWISPMARALLKAREGDMVSVQTPEGRREVEIVEVRYEALP